MYELCIFRLLNKFYKLYDTVFRKKQKNQFDNIFNDMIKLHDVAKLKCPLAQIIKKYFFSFLPWYLVSKKNLIGLLCRQLIMTHSYVILVPALVLAMGVKKKVM